MAETTTQETGADARVVNEQALAAARDEAVEAERQRVERDRVAARQLNFRIAFSADDFDRAKAICRWQDARISSASKRSRR